MEEPAISGNEVTITRSTLGNKGKLINTTFLPETQNAEITPIGGPGKEFWVNGTNYETKPKGNYNEADFELGAWRVELSPKTPASEDNFLNVMQIMDKSINQKLEVRRIDGENIAGVQVSDRIVVFSKSSGNIDRPFSISVKGNGAFKILLTDLLSGTWQVKKDNQVFIPSILVKKDDGLIYFEGTQGEYSFLR